MVVMPPALSPGPGHEFTRRGTDKAAKVAGQVRLVEVAMPRRQRRQTNPGPRTLRAGESCLDVRQDTLQAEDPLKNLGADTDVDIEQASELTVRNSGSRRRLADACGTVREQPLDASLDDRIRCHSVRRLHGQPVQEGPERLPRRRGGRESVAERPPAWCHVLDGDVCVPQVTGRNPEESGRHARPQAYTHDRDSRFEDLDGWTGSRAPNIESAAEPMHKMNSAVRHRAMAVRLTPGGNLLHPHAPNQLTEPPGWGKLAERGPRAMVYTWIPHQPCSVGREPIARPGSSHGEDPGMIPPHSRRTADPRGRGLPSAIDRGQCSGLITELVGTNEGGFS
jgi:hypothetical protein